MSGWHPLDSEFQAERSQNRLRTGSQANPTRVLGGALAESAPHGFAANPMGERVLGAAQGLGD
jgi:hypothetical protein